MRRWFIDMDGTLNVFQAVDEIEELYEKSFFLNAVPQMKMVRRVQELIDVGEDVYILSSVLMDSKYALDEKNTWLDKYLPEINEAHRLFVPYGTEKWKLISGGVTKQDILVDDYSVNLHEWVEAGGTGIKALNGINGTRGSWVGKSVSVGEERSEQICR